MSYILEALRRAEAERQASSGAQQSLQATGPSSAALAPRRRWPLAVALLLVLVLAAAMGAWWARPDPPPPAPAPAAAVAWPRAALEEPPAPAEAPRRAPASTPSAAAVRPAPLITPPSSAPMSTAAASKAGPAGTADAPAPPRLAELPAAWRQQLPPLQVGGAMYSPEPALRSLILNGQLYKEGDAVGADLQVERIEARSAVLRFKGQAFVLSF